MRKSEEDESKKSKCWTVHCLVEKIILINITLAWFPCL